MSLPIIQLPTGVYTFKSGDTTKIRGVSRAEALQIRALMDDVPALERKIVQCATGITEEEVIAWFAATPSGEVEELVDAISRLSGLNPDAGKEDAGDSPSAK